MMQEQELVMENKEQAFPTELSSWVKARGSWHV